MGKVLEQTKCPNPQCGSSDALTVYLQEDGSTDAHCYSCGKTYHTWPLPEANLGDADTAINAINSPAQRVGSFSVPSLQEHKIKDLQQALNHPVREIKDRRLNFSTCDKFGVRVGVDTRDGITPIYYLFPRYKNNKLSGFVQKFIPSKNFAAIGDIKDCEPFGLNLIPESGKKLFITEGPEDCMALYQVLKENSTINWEPAVIGLFGAKSSINRLLKYSDKINNYDQIILALDQDAAGEEAAMEICKIFSGKAYVASFSEKDPNEMLIKGKANDLKWSVLTNSRKYQPDGIVNAKDCWDRYKNSRNAICYPYPTTMAGLNDKTYGVRPGTIVTVTAGSGCGKTQFLRELKYHYWATTDFKIADIALEEDIGDTIGGMLSLHLNKRITLPDVDVSEQEEEKAFKEMFESGRFELYDFFGGMDDETLFSKLKYLIAIGHKLLFLDHLSIIVSEYASNGGERERIDTIMTKLAKLVKETGAIIFLVVHLKKSERTTKTFEEGTIPTLDDLRGSASIKQLSWDVIGLSRNQQHPDQRCANTTEVTVLKCRFTGRTGNSGYLFFDENTGRLLSVPEPINYRK